jgi:predicted nucleotidyltransferase/DNA-binding XRE family transcriptional regulator
MAEGNYDFRSRHLLRQSRHRAHLMQAEVAANADLPQSTVSAYEAGQRQPTLAMLSKLLEAMGWELRVEAAPLPAHLATLTGPVGRRIRRHRQQIVELADRNGFHNVRVFGAVARGTEGPGARITLLLDPDPTASPVTRLTLDADLEELLGFRVSTAVLGDLTPAARREAGAGALAL